MAYMNKNVTPSNYLIEKVNSNNYILHRELNRGEIPPKDVKIFTHNSKKFIPAVARFSSESEAKRAVQSYWSGNHDKLAQ